MLPIVFVIYIFFLYLEYRFVMISSLWQYCNGKFALTIFDWIASWIRQTNYNYEYTNHVNKGSIIKAPALFDNNTTD